AEHVMLLDLGRNDVGRVAAIGTVQVTESFVIERYSHVMHLVSNVRATLAPGRDCFDAFRATFPAGTLTGAPKIRAMEIIEELEPVRRGVYGGAVGYFAFSGAMDTAITIRFVLFREGRVYVQAGAGIVADSDPEAEHRECVNKARAMLQAARLAHHAREDLAHPARRACAVRGPPPGLRGDALPLAGDRSGDAAGRARALGMDRRGRDHGRPAPHAVRRGRAVPPRVDPHHRGQAAARQLPRPPARRPAGARRLTGARCRSARRSRAWPTATTSPRARWRRAWRRSSRARRARRWWPACWSRSA